MTPVNLLMALKSEMESAVKNYKMKAENQADKPVSVYVQHIPDDAFEDDTYYPFILVTLQKVNDNEDENRDSWEASTATIGIMASVHGEDREAWRDLLNLMEHIRQRLLTKRTIDAHRLILPVKWEIPEVQPYPYWHAYGTLEYTTGQPQGELPTAYHEIMEEV